MEKLKNMFSSKISVLFLIMMMFIVALALNSNALISSVTINFPANNQYNSSGSSTNSVQFILNASVEWTDPTNVTNLTFWFTGANNTPFGFVNSTINGSRTTVTTGHFTVNISASTLPEGAYTIIAEARNDSAIKPAGSLNSSSITFTIDRTNSIVTLNRPHQREGVSVSEGAVTLEYTPSDTNLGNATLYLNDVVEKSSTSGTTSSNLTNGGVNKFTKRYTANDNSESWIVEITDLAGLKTNSSAFTYSVLVYGGEVTTRQFTPSGQPIPTQADAQGRAIQTPLAVSGVGFGELAKQFWWVGALVALVGIFIYYKTKNKLQ